MKKLVASTTSSAAKMAKRKKLRELATSGAKKDLANL